METRKCSSSVKNLGSTFDSYGHRKIDALTQSTGGRLIPMRQGYMYKKCGSSRSYKWKYVTLCSDSLMTYYRPFQASIDNVCRKAIDLTHVIVKDQERNQPDSNLWMKLTRKIILSLTELLK